MGEPLKGLEVSIFVKNTFFKQSEFQVNVSLGVKIPNT